MFLTNLKGVFFVLFAETWEVKILSLMAELNGARSAVLLGSKLNTLFFSLS